MNAVRWGRLTVAVLGVGSVGVSWYADSAAQVRPTLGTEPVTALVGPTVIDGTGAPPLSDATVVLQGRRIIAVGRRSSVVVPAQAEVIDGRGRFVVPGFVDVHFWGDYGPQTLQYGVTTVRGGSGNEVGIDLEAELAKTRELQASGLPGPRAFLHGPFVGWTRDGWDEVERNYRVTPTHYGVPVPDGMDAELTMLDLDSLRARTNRFLDAGVGYVKYGGTTHTPTGLIPFSLRAQRAIVEEVHKRGLAVDVHATGVEGLRLTVLAGIDNIVHAETNEEPHLGDYERPWPDDLVQLIVQRGVTCILLPMSAPEGARPLNERKLIQAGCPIAVMSDHDSGRPTVKAIVALVTKAGLTPMEALVAATRNGARACKQLDQFGTVTAGKLADLVVLRADPLQDIKNIVQTVMVFAAGRRVDVNVAERDREKWAWDLPR